MTRPGDGAVATRPVAILIAALGGEGGGVLAEWLVEAATRAGYPAQGPAIPGVAQRTGATTYYVEIYPVRRARLGGVQPVLGLYPVPGGIDLLVASELLETGRAVASGLVSPDRTTLIASLARALTTHEKIALGDGRFDSARLLAVARGHSRRLIAFDMDEAARASGTMLSAVMLGAVAASGVLPIPPEIFDGVIRDSGIGVEGSLRGFARGYEAVAGNRVAEVREPPRGAAAPSAPPAQIAAAFPRPVHAMLGAGYARLVDFQDRAYAELYVERLRAILAAERVAGGSAAHGYPITRETARFLALWMAFDDVVRVASLKCRASRFARVRREVGAGEGDVVRIVDYLKPGMLEIAGLLPASLSRRLVAWDRRRQARGKPPVAFAVHLRSDGIAGFALLRTLAGLRWLRRHGARYAEEQALIERWLAAVARATRADWRLGHELALCGRLIKGYGATNERGKRNLLHIVDHLAELPGADPAARAEAVRQAREAALADEAGTALDSTLVRHGAPPRPTVAQPIAWTRRRTAAPARGAVP